MWSSVSEGPQVQSFVSPNQDPILLLNEEVAREFLGKTGVIAGYRVVVAVVVDAAVGDVED